MAVTIRDGVSYSVPFEEASEKPLGADTQIDFAGLSAADAAVTTFVIKTTCASASDQLTETSTIHGVSRFSLAGVLPRSLFASQDLSLIASYTCNIVLHASDAVGSTHDASLTTFHLAGSEVLETLSLKAGSIQAQQVMDASHSLASVTAEDVQLAPAVSSDLSADYNLYCDHLSNHRTRAAGEDPHDVLRDLIRGEIERRDLRTLDPRDSFTIQKCRLVVRSNDPQTGASEVSATPTFTLNYPLPKNESTSTFDLAAGAVRSQSFIGLSETRLNSSAFLTFTIRNTSTAPEAYAIPKELSLTLTRVSMSSLDQHSGRIIAPYPALSFSNSIAVDYDVVGDSGRTFNPSEQVFEVAPGSTLTIRMKAKDDWRCPVDQAPGFGSPSLVGYHYSFDTTSIVREFANWDPSVHDLSGQTKDATPKTLREQITQLGLGGWWSDYFYAGQPAPTAQPAWAAAGNIFSSDHSCRLGPPPTLTGSASDRFYP